MPLAKPDAVWSDYIEHLQILAIWLTPLEHWLRSFSDGPQNAKAFGFICYSDLILQDLGDDHKPPTSQLSQQITWPQQDNAAYRWGIAYVIEGSQLGGEFLYKRLSVRLAPHKLHYLQSKQPGRWPAFLQALAVAVTTPEDISSACAGAVDAFDALLQQLPVRV